MAPGTIEEIAQQAGALAAHADVAEADRAAGASAAERREGRIRGAARAAVEAVENGGGWWLSWD
jgi:hypothetical protein